MAEKKFEIKRAERRIEICLDGALVAEYEAVEAELETARRAAIADRRLNSPVKGLEKRQAELYKAQEDHTLVLTVRGLPRAVWSKIKEDHPARDGNPVDENLGFNVDDAVNAAMLAEGSIVLAEQAGEPVEFTVEDWAAISPDLSEGQWQEIQTAVVSANGGRPKVPFSQSGYKLMQDSAESSK